MTSVSGAPLPLDLIAYTTWTRDSVGDAGELRFVAAAKLRVTLVFRGPDQAAEAEIRSMAFDHSLRDS